MMDNIQGKINDSNLFTEGKHDVESTEKTNKLYSKTNEILKAYSSVQDELMKKLNHEADSIRAVAEQYYKLDQQLGEGAEKL